MTYKHKKFGFIIKEFTIMGAQKALGVLSTPNWEMIVGIGTDGKHYPVCYAEDNADARKAQIKRIISEDYEITK